jgi:hypothetical protein
VASPGGGPSKLRSSRPGERTHDDAIGLPNAARGALIRRDGEQA